MLPILLIHGYSGELSTSTDGSADYVDAKADLSDVSHFSDPIYGSLPQDLANIFGSEGVKYLNLSRWISMNDGIALDDVSFALDRALSSAFPQLLVGGFNVIVHSTGSLVIRNWIRLFSPKPCPIVNLVHLAGPHFGSGLAHIGRGQLVRWGRMLQGSGCGVRILNELEFGAWKTLDLHGHFLLPGQSMVSDYRVQEYCIAGSQTLAALRALPIRYVKEDSSDNTVRTSASNLNYNYLSIRPAIETARLSAGKVKKMMASQLNNDALSDQHYVVEEGGLAARRPPVPFCVAYETAHFGKEMGIVQGMKNRREVLPLIKAALETPANESAYENAWQVFSSRQAKTFERIAKRRVRDENWDKLQQYEAHSQLIFRLRDQFGQAITDFDINIRSLSRRGKHRLESLIEDKHLNTHDGGTLTFYLRTQRFDKQRASWKDLLHNVVAAEIEVNAYEEGTDDIIYVPLSLKLTPAKIRAYIQNFRTTIVDITLLRVPGSKVLRIKAMA